MWIRGAGVLCVMFRFEFPRCVLMSRLNPAAAVLCTPGQSPVYRTRSSLKASDKCSCLPCDLQSDPDHTELFRGV